MAQDEQEQMQNLHIELMQAHADYKELFDKIVALGEKFRQLENTVNGKLSG